VIFSTTPISTPDVLILAERHHQAGRTQAAESLCRQVLHREPSNATALHLLGLTAHASGQDQQAIDLLRRSVQLAPQSAEWRSNLGAVLAKSATTAPDEDADRDQRLSEAIACFRAALDLRPDFPEAHRNLGSALADAGLWSQAQAPLRRAIALLPRDPDPLIRLALCRESLADAAEAVDLWRKAVQLRPTDAHLHSNLILAMNYCDRFTQADIFEETKHWAARHAGAGIGYGVSGTSSAVALPPDTRNPIPDTRRRRRIAYLSPELRDHPGARFLFPVIAAHDRKRVEVFIYNDARSGARRVSEGVNGIFQTLADHWRDTASLTDQQLADQIRADEIDVLIEATGHMAAHRLGVFALRPAPLQITYPGYPGTTGLSQIDLCLTDATRDPLGSERYYAERLLRLPGSSQAYDPALGCDPLPDIDPTPPIRRNHAVTTFGCFNRLVKITPATIRLWSSAMNQIPRSRLLLLAPGRDMKARRVSEGTGLLDAFASQGVTADQIEFLPRRPRREYLDLYNRIDIALDTFPYQGHTTTLDALAMGVPTISRLGQTRPARESPALLHPDFIAGTDETFTQAATMLAQDPARLCALRSSLRKTIAKSPLANGFIIAQALATAKI
jgi:predicted O-linked N-acetylglucosamine transferase (SPINDLY family)